MRLSENGAQTPPIPRKAEMMTPEASLMIGRAWSTSLHPRADRVAGRKPELLICATLVHGDLHEPK